MIYKINYETKPSIIGSAIPQIQTMIPEYRFKNANSIWNFANSGMEPDLDGFVVHKNAKLTDLLSCAHLVGDQFLFSQNLFQKIIEFETSNFNSYNAYIYIFMTKRFLIH